MQADGRRRCSSGNLHLLAAAVGGPGDGATPASQAACCHQHQAAQQHGRQLVVITFGALIPLFVW